MVVWQIQLGFGGMLGKLEVVHGILVIKSTQYFIRKKAKTYVNHLCSVSTHTNILSANGMIIFLISSSLLLISPILSTHKNIRRCSWVDKYTKRNGFCLILSSHRTKKE